MTSLRFTIMTPGETLFQKEVSRVTLGTDGGVLTILPRHADMIASVSFSHVEVQGSDGVRYAFLARLGTLAMHHDENSLVLMASHAEEKKRSASVSAQEYLAYLEDEMAKGHSLSAFHLAYLKEERFAIERQIASETK